MKEVVQLLTKQQKARVFLFGSKAEAELLNGWANELENVESVAGKMAFSDELTHMAQLDLMISMDSANMHLASLFGVPVVSVWGSTHPYAGFYGWGQSGENAVQVELYCRPCSVFGTVPVTVATLPVFNLLAPLLFMKGQCRS
jgi:ADP-heptose:LPS heptosyltransferase